jgi:hypothetical protein
MPAAPRSRRLPALLVAGALAVTASGCASPGTACPAIAWADEARIQLTGSAEAVARVTWVSLCDDRECSRSAEDPRDPEADGLPPMGPTYEAVPTGSDTWTVRLVMSTPERVTLTAFADDATVLADLDADLAWTRVGGSAECGGPAVSDPVELAIPG